MLNKKWIRRAFNLKHIVTILIASLLSAMSMFLFSGSVRSMAESNNFLKNRNYNYSVVIDKEVESDSYSYYENKISFYANDNLSILLPASVLMRLNCDYTSNDFLYGEISLLKPNEIVITNNLARQYKISVGDSLFSKNPIDNNVNQFAVKVIIPDLYSVIGISNDIESGVIIKGFDYSFFTEVTSNFVFFYDNDYSCINKFGATIIGGTLTAKSDQIKKNNSQLFFEITITLIFCLSVQLIANFLLFSFNKKYYIFCKEYGMKGSFKKPFLDLIFYEFLILTLSSVLYLLLSFFSIISFIQYICFLSSIIFSFFAIYFVSKKAIKRR